MGVTAEGKGWRGGGGDAARSVLETEDPLFVRSLIAYLETFMCSVLIFMFISFSLCCVCYSCALPQCTSPEQL